MGENLNNVIITEEFTGNKKALNGNESNTKINAPNTANSAKNQHQNTSSIAEIGQKIKSETTMQQIFLQDNNAFEEVFKIKSQSEFLLSKMNLQSKAELLGIKPRVFNNFFKAKHDEYNQKQKELNKQLLENKKDVSQLDFFKCELYFDYNNKFLHNVFADDLIAFYKIKKIFGVPYFYHDGLYTNDDKLFRNKMINIISNLKTAQQNEVINYIKNKIAICKETNQANARYIPLKNYIYDIKTNKKIEYTDDYIFFNKFPYDYHENAYSESMDKFLDMVSCNNKEIRMLIEEMFGYTLYRSLEFDKIFILQGNGGNGKSTIINIIQTLVGEKNVSYLHIQDYTERFQNFELVNKVVNIGDDTPSTYISNTATIKNIATGGKIYVEQKGQDGFHYRPYCTSIFTLNKLPRANDDTYGWNRRLCIIPLKYVFEKTKNFDRKFRDKEFTAEEMLYLNKIAINAIKRVIENNGFTLPSEVAQALHEYKKDNNNILEFLDQFESYSYFINKKRTDIYKEYQLFCENNGLKPCANKELAKCICEKFNLLEYSYKRKETDNVTIRGYKLSEEALKDIKIPENF